MATMPWYGIVDEANWMKVMLMNGHCWIVVGPTWPMPAVMAIVNGNEGAKGWSDFDC
jgi:hypothetical protein